MNAKTEQAGSGMDTIKLLAVVVLLVAGVYGFYAFAEQPLWVRLAGLLTIVGAAVFVALQTAVGRTVWQFAVDSRTEVRKVVWPTRQETLQTLLIITIAVLLTALFMWLVDSVLFGIVRYLTGQGD
ncbi:MAG: preprotein translocase subunit SecE [Gammaproteobacteria bacterium]|nr:preprotein translocase subunit SecE [Gammaproteobacteria bacterium]MCB1818208.1 preprotein translocase subunit SecE [Gammaproteobacteria bacterium]MCP5317549.1 preprotein translocase subunit SecE [Chromatiaceae bacterium]MCP5431227.1 preprotein translocase subunit SecE [Chromatiaceae bacterium]MCW5587708.1 preprotein translocase subunit SecE [Chromatiales bacterium]